MAVYLMIKTACLFTAHLFFPIPRLWAVSPSFSTVAQAGQNTNYDLTKLFQVLATYFYEIHTRKLLETILRNCKLLRILSFLRQITQ